MTTRNKPYKQEDINSLLSHHGKETSSEISEKIGINASTIRIIQSEYNAFRLGKLHRVRKSFRPLFAKYKEIADSQTSERHNVTTSEVQNTVPPYGSTPVPPEISDPKALVQQKQQEYFDAVDGYYR